MTFGMASVPVAALLLSATAASAQTLTGAFDYASGWWLHPTQGTLGVMTDGSTISIDRDGDGVAESDYAVPTINAAPLAAPNLRLTPTREVLFAFGDVCGSAGTMVYFFEVPAPPAALSLLDSACIEYGIGQVGFYDTGLCVFNGMGLDCAGRLGVSPLRRAYVADQGNTFTGLAQIRWFDLNDGVHAKTFPGFNRPMPFTFQLVSPYGDVAAVQHGVGSTSDYTLVDLCAGSRLGTPLSSNVGGELFGLTGLPAIDMVDRGGGDFVVRFTHPDLPGGGDDFAFTPCGGAPPSDIGACCGGDATCADKTSSDCETSGGKWLGPLTDCADCPEPVGACCSLYACIPDVGESACISAGGTWPGAGSTCETCPPPLRLSISKSGPPSVVEGSWLTYTLDYANVGGQTADSVSIQDTIPTGTTFVSASDGGIQNAGRAEWQLGTLGVGESGSVQLTVRVACGRTTVINDTYRILSGFLPFNGTPVATTVTASSAAPVDVLIESVPPRDPLRWDDVVEHAVTLTNTVAEARAGLNFRAAWGHAADFEAIIDDAGGSVQFSGVSSMTWTGALDALESRTVRFSTRIRECTTLPEDRLNSGSDISVRNSCSTVLGTAPVPPAVPIELPTETSWGLLGSGPPQRMFGRTYQVARAGSKADLQITLSNRIEIEQSVSIEHVIPPALVPQGDPPFVSPTDAGASYDNVTQTIYWSGTIPPHAEVLITYRVLVPETGCQADAQVYGGTGACTNDLDLNATLLLVPPLRTDSHAILLGPFTGIFDSPPPRALLCIRPEISFGLGRGGNGDLFIAGVPNFLFNPATLEFRILDGEYESTFAEAVLGLQQFPLAYDAAVDPRDGTAIYVGNEGGAPPTRGGIGRYDADSGQFMPIVASEELYRIKRVVVGSDGLIGTVGSHDGVVQIDPSSPNDLQVFSDLAVPWPTCIAQDANGDYVVASDGPPKVLARVDRVSGAYTILVPDLDALLTVPGSFTGAAVGTGSEIYLASDVGGAMVVNLGPPASAQPFGYGQTPDVEFVAAPQSCPNGAGDGDGDGDVDLDDHGSLVNCLAGPGGGRESACICFDTDLDGDVDLRDTAGWQRLFGP